MGGADTEDKLAVVKRENSVSLSEQTGSIHAVDEDLLGIET